MREIGFGVGFVWHARALVASFVTLGVLCCDASLWLSNCLDRVFASAQCLGDMPRKSGFFSCALESVCLCNHDHFNYTKIRRQPSKKKT